MLCGKSLPTFLSFSLSTAYLCLIQKNLQSSSFLSRFSILIYPPSGPTSSHIQRFRSSRWIVPRVYPNPPPSLTPISLSHSSFHTPFLSGICCSLSLTLFPSPISIPFFPSRAAVITTGGHPYPTRIYHHFSIPFPLLAFSFIKKKLKLKFSPKPVLSFLRLPFAESS
ncbi:hypothetical protein VNO77_04722 [Canavalia gladiata]|uniref:Uncharacterized protein n=1 Tax=Canavalia gladiata TaxID=3824 RepID=A0AAN9N2P6_CANGL